MKDKVIESITQTDMSDLTVPMIAVYENPLDHPDKCVARIFNADKPTDTVIVKESMEEIMDDIQNNTYMTFVLRGAEDPENLVGVWV